MFENFPPPEELIKLEPEEIALFMLFEWGKRPNADIFRQDYLENNISFKNYAGNMIIEVSKVFYEGWSWLEKEVLIARNPNKNRDCFFITRKGIKLRNHTDLQSYKMAELLSMGSLDPVLERKVRPLFLRGDYETAVFQSFKEIEVRVRKYSNYSERILGSDLMRKAFNNENGPLTDKNVVNSEREAMSNLFAGAIGAFKNPTSHRDVNYQNANEVAKIILFADLLLKIVESRYEICSEIKQ